MTAKTREEVYGRAAPEDRAVSTAPTSTVRAAAEYAAEAFAPDEVEKHAQAIMDAIEVRLKEQTRKYTKEAMAQAEQTKKYTKEAMTQARPQKEMAARIGAGGEQLEAAGPIGQPYFLPPYPWFELLCAGPFQPVPGPVIPATGPFLPHKVIRANEYAFMIGILWRNPGGINWDPYNPSAASVMSGMNFTVWFEPINLTNVTNVPAGLGPFNFNSGNLGPGPVNTFLVLISPGTFPTPPSGRPHLYEINMTVDVTGPGPTVASLPFSGFSTWLFDPDQEPPVFPPPITPGVPPQLQHDVPARFLVHV